jgi:hypothetical protein
MLRKKRIIGQEVGTQGFCSLMLVCATYSFLIRRFVEEPPTGFFTNSSSSWSWLPLRTRVGDLAVIVSLLGCCGYQLWQSYTKKTLRLELMKEVFHVCQMCPLRTLSTT